MSGESRNADLISVVSFSFLNKGIIGILLMVLFL